jgi:hypothetical protein
MSVDITQTFSHQAVRFDELHHFVMLRMCRRGESLQQRENFDPVFEIAAGEFPNDEWVTKNMALIQ